MTPGDDDASDRTQRFQELTRDGPRSAEEMLPLVYEELRALARARMVRELPGVTLQPRLLVPEAWLRLVGDEDPG
ncbi:MAG: hypothetical protein CMJ83_07780 [Planctomycetes bacterium]|nr:hypothetical protein [Planctomycetota bacterium]